MPRGFVLSVGDPVYGLTLPAGGGAVAVTGAVGVDLVVVQPGDAEPTYGGADVLIYPIDPGALGYEAGLDGYPSLAARYAKLQQLRAAQGVSTHDLFIHDNRSTDADPVSSYAIITGRGGSGYALRSIYPALVDNQGSGWLTLPLAPAKYSPDSATIAWQAYVRFTVGWGPGNIGYKGWEWWHPDPGTNGRSQLSLVPAGGGLYKWQMSWSSHPSGGAYAGVQDGEVAPVGSHFPNDGEWHRFTYLYQPKTTLLDSTTGKVRLWIDGVLVFDVSLAGYLAGRCSLLALQSISNLRADVFKWPDVCVSVPDLAPGYIDYDDLLWWVEV